jgi:hypothetical protein
MPRAEEYQPVLGYKAAVIFLSVDRAGNGRYLLVPDRIDYIFEFSVHF